MNRSEFKKEYFTNSFYWVTKDNYSIIQEIGVEFGCVNTLGDKYIIAWHRGFKNIGFRTYAKNNFVTVFQKEAFLTESETAQDVDMMLYHYKNLTI